MRGLVALWLLVLAPGLMWAQASPQQMDSPPNNTADDLRALREDLAHAQKQGALQQEEIESLNQRMSPRQPAAVSAQAEARKGLTRS